MTKTIQIAAPPAESAAVRTLGRAGPSEPARRGSAPARRELAVNLGQLVGSHLVVGVAGLASLPILARNLGPEAYGRFSLFVLALGVLSNLDVARPILVREGSAEGTARDSVRLAATSGWLLAPIAFAAGAWIGGPWTALALAAAVFLHAACSAPFARLSAAGRVGVAGSIRNACWTLALLSVVGASFVTTSAHAYVWAFAGANAAILLVYRSTCREAVGIEWLAPSLSSLRRRRAQCADVAGFAAASAVVASADKVVLETNVSGAAFGQYAAQYDLATKINIVSTALGSILLPSLARLHAERGYQEAARAFVRTASRIALAYFLALAALTLVHAEVIRLVFGAAFVAELDSSVYVLMLAGVFIHLFGFLITSFQRACGDFGTHRRAYVASAVLMLAVGLATIPRLGATGAVLTYLSGRSAELLLILVEVRRMPRLALPRWRIAALAAMVLGLAAAAAWQVAGGAAR